MIRVLAHILVILGLVALTIVTYNKDIKFNLMINSKVYTEKLVLNERNNGLKGANLRYVIQHPHHANELIAKGPGGNYYSKDAGANWNLLVVDGYKYAGELSGNAPNIFWDYEGRMVTTIGNYIYWSMDGETWSREPIEHPAEIIGIGDDKKLWLKGKVNDNEESVFYEWLDWSPEKKPIIKIREYADLKVEPVLISNLMYVAGNWLIDKGILYCKEKTSDNWTEKCQGICRPVVHYFMQDKDNPEHILAATSTNSGFSGGFYRNRDIVYWKTDNFGANWQQCDSAIFHNWELADTILPDTRHCNLHIEGGSAFIGSNIIKSNYYSIKGIEDVGWVEKNQYYLIGREGIQIGKGTKKCAYGEQVIWSWGEADHIDNTLYHLGALNNYSRLYLLKRTSSFGETEYLTKQYKKVVTFVKNDTLQVMMPGNYGGVWYAKIPMERPFTFRRLLHIFVQNRLIIFLNLIYIIYVVTFLGKSEKR